MAKEARKLKRAAARGGSRGKDQRKALSKPVVQAPAEMPDPLAPKAIKSMGLRLGLPILATWIVGGLIAGISQSETATWVALGIPGAVTVIAAGLVIWAVRYARRARGVQNLLRDAGSAEGRKEALSELDASYKKKDHTAIFARAQLLMQEDPKAALEELEKIDLSKAMATVADEARAQRAMIHLMHGEVKEARPLADGIELKRQQDAKARATMAAVISEAWARSGQAKKALETLDLYDPQDDEYVQVRGQLYRAQAYAFAHTNDLKKMRRALRKLLDEDVRLLGAFMMKRTHPLLQKEAKKMIERSGQVKPRMEIRRR